MLRRRKLCRRKRSRFEHVIGRGRAMLGLWWSWGRRVGMLLKRGSAFLDAGERGGGLGFSLSGPSVLLVLGRQDALLLLLLLMKVRWWCGYCLRCQRQRLVWPANLYNQLLGRGCVRFPCLLHHLGATPMVVVVFLAGQRRGDYACRRKEIL